MGRENTRIECLDGLRGLAALWVLTGHAMLLTGFRLPLISRPDLGVDLFILLSGFLMVFHYQLREVKEPWDAPSTWMHFWARRFFRIAPLYYIALAAALILGPPLFHGRTEIARLIHDQAQTPGRYMDHSALNLGMHLSFLFGLDPYFAFRTVLPDWSIGLEMQFYAAFPFLMLIIKRFGWMGGGITVVLIAAIAGHEANRVLSFPMPSFLLLKLHVFMAGMLIAAALRSGPAGAWQAGIVAVLLVMIPVGGWEPLHLMLRVAMVVGFFLLVHDRLFGGGGMGRALRTVASWLGAPFSHWLGELSYGVYLIHLFILIPATAWLIGRFGTEISPVIRFAAALLITMPVTYVLAAAMHFAVERPGQDLGRWAIRQGRALRGAG
jgi:peptidoglycan/LPS O-acetylase OafA/YrhL